MNPTVIGFIFAVLLFVGMIAAIQIGHSVAVRQLARDPSTARPGLTAVEGAVFALLGLMIAFAFSGAIQRFDARRHLVAEEANAIGTAWLRIDLVSIDAQADLRELFRRYLDSRFEIYRAIEVDLDVRAELARSSDLQREIWREAVAAAQSSDPVQPALLLLQAVNEMIDITTLRTAAGRTHSPVIVFSMLGALALAGALLAGYTMAGSVRLSRMHVVLFSAVIAATFYITVDLEYPRLGLIRVDAIDQVLVEVRESMD